MKRKKVDQIGTSEAVSLLSALGPVTEIPPGVAHHFIYNKLHSLCTSYWRNSTGSSALRDDTQALDQVINVSGRCEAMGADSSDSSQEDSADFLYMLIDAIRDATRSDKKKDDPEQIPVNPTMDGLFTVSKRTVWTCSQCSTLHDSGVINNEVHGLSVGVQGTTSTPLNDYLHQAVNNTGDMRCTNLNCNPMRLANPEPFREEITAAPEYLILKLTSIKMTLKGVGQNRRAYFSKAQSLVDIPEWLNLGPYLAWDVPNQAYWYKLVSIVKHTGNTLDSGHYTGGFRAPPPGRKDKPFDEVNDEAVAAMTLDEYKETFPKNGVQLPYIVTYMRYIHKPN
jgi:ubiquitin C-terminal hydrolase